MTRPEDDRSAYLLGIDEAGDDDLRAEHDSTTPALEDEPAPDEQPG
jgi:hypothetical protein